MLSPRIDSPKKLPTSARQIGVKRKTSSPMNAGARKAYGIQRRACMRGAGFRRLGARSALVFRDLAVDLLRRAGEDVLDVAAGLHVAQRHAQNVLVFAEPGRRRARERG